MSLAYALAIKEGATPEDRGLVQAVFNYWRVWVEEQMAHEESISPRELLGLYLERIGLHTCS